LKFEIKLSIKGIWDVYFGEVEERYSGFEKSKFKVEISLEGKLRAGDSV
jgi:hypothetical protein